MFVFSGLPHQLFLQLSGNLQFNSPILGPLWPTADEVETERGILIGTSDPGVTTDQVVTLFRRYYPGAFADIDRVLVVDWSRDPWAMACEARDYQPGHLHKFEAMRLDDL